MLIWATRLALMETPENLQLSGQITSARANLATMYGDGTNVEKDLLKSYVWFLIYNESKRDFSILVQQENIENIKNLEKQLTSNRQRQCKNSSRKIVKQKVNKPYQSLQPGLIVESEKRRTTMHCQKSGLDIGTSASVRLQSFVWCDIFLLIISFQLIIFLLLIITTGRDQQ